MFYFTLGSSENPLLYKYQQAFLRELEHLWKTYIDPTIPDYHFLLLPDVHSNLLALSSMDLRRNTLRETLREQHKIWKENDGGLSHSQNFISGTKIELTDSFSNPYIATDSHPDHIKNGIEVTFGNKTFAEWEALFSETFRILQKTSPGFYDEINFLLKKILPFGISHGTHNSGSYSNVIGHITMSYPEAVDSPEIVILEALIHEYNHNKINLILQSEVLLKNDFREIYYSPYRPDPRTIHGVYLGLHALAGAYWVIWKAYMEGSICLKEKDIQKGVLYVLKNSLSVQILEKYAHLTPLGKIFFLEMKRVHTETLRFMKNSHIVKEILESSKGQMKEHYTSVCNIYPNILG